MFGDTHDFQGLVNDARTLEMVIGEEVELVEKIADINAAKWIHL